MAEADDPIVPYLVKMPILTGGCCDICSGGDRIGFGRLILWQIPPLPGEVEEGDY